MKRHPCIVRGRQGSTERLLNLFQPGKKNARQHRHAPVACVDPHRLWLGKFSAGARQVQCWARLTAGAFSCWILTPSVSACFVGFCCHCSNLAQMARDVPRVRRARLCPHASGVAGLAPSRQIAMTAAMIAGPTNNPISPNVSKPPKMPRRTHRKGNRVDAPISAGRTK